MADKGVAAQSASKRGRWAAMFRWPERLSVGRPDGIVLGRSGSVMLRRIHFFAGDFSEAVWYREGRASPPVAELPATIRLRWLSPEEWRAKPDILETPADVAAGRFAAGARCLIGWDETADRLMYHLWVTWTGAYIGWIFRYVAPPPGHLMVFDVWVHPDYRGGNVHWAGAAYSCAEARRCGFTRIFAGVEEHEFYPFITKYVRLGLALPYPHSQMLGLKFFGFETHIAGGPEPRLLAFSERLRALYAKRAPGN